MSDVLGAMLAALDNTGPEPLKGPDANNPYKPVPRRAPRSGDPSKWSPPVYRDRDAERVVGQLSKKRKKKQ